MLEIVTPLAIGLLVPIALLAGRALAIEVAARRRRPVAVRTSPTEVTAAGAGAVPIPVRAEPQPIPVIGGKTARALRIDLRWPWHRPRSASKARRDPPSQPMGDHVHMRAGRYPGSPTTRPDAPVMLERVPSWIATDAAECPWCAVSRSKGANFCGRCGRPIEQDVAAAPRAGRQA